MFRLCSVFLGYVLTSLIKILGFLSGYLVYRSKPDGGGEGSGSNFSVNHSHEDGQLVSKNSTGFWSCGLSGKIWEENSDDSDGKIGVTEEVGLIAKYQFVSGEDARRYFQEPRTEKIVVQDMFVGSGEGNDESLLDCENFEAEDSLGKALQGFDEESNTSALCFKLFNASCFATGDGSFGVSCREEDCQEPEKIGCADSEGFGGMDVVGDEILVEKDVSFEVEMLPDREFTAPISNQESDAPDDDAMRNVDWRIEALDEALLCGSVNWMGSFLEESDQIGPGDHHEAKLGIDHTQRVTDLDDEYIEIEPQSSGLMHIVKERVSFEDGNSVNGPHEHTTLLAGEATLQDSHQEQKNSWDSGNGDDDDDEQDVLWEHQHLVQQMKMELKNCRTRGLPTISEECETPKIAEDLKPLHIEQKLEYKDVVKEIQKFYKSYTEKMRKLDTLNYQTLHAISLLRLKVSEVIAAGNTKGDWVPFVLAKMRPYKVQRIYADPMHKLILELYHDLELVYIGQICLSWEILCWMYMKARELLGYDPEGNHSYNRVADEFQQFQVLLQRFVEDEQFQGERLQNYVTSRCVIKCLLQIPTIRDDSSKIKKEQTDAVSLELLIPIIRESMLIFRDFFFADKGSMTTVLIKDIQETKLDPQSAVDSQLLVEIITDLHKKERKIREHIRSQNCIVKKLKRHHHHNQELRPGDDDVAVWTSQVELKLVSRVLSLSRLTRDQLIWCQNKMKNINFVRREIHLESTFLLFPC